MLTRHMALRGHNELKGLRACLYDLIVYGISTGSVSVERPVVNKIIAEDHREPG